MTDDPKTPARHVVEFARSVLAIELEHWQAESLEGLITSYGTACVMVARADDAAVVSAEERPKTLAPEPGPVPDSTWPYGADAVGGAHSPGGPDKGIQHDPATMILPIQPSTAELPAADAPRTPDRADVDDDRQYRAGQGDRG